MSQLITMKDGHDVEAWVMVKDIMVAEETGIGVCRINIESESSIGDGPSSSRFVVVDYDMSHDVSMNGASLTKTGTISTSRRTGSITKKTWRFITKFNSAHASEESDFLKLDKSKIKTLEKDFEFHQVNVWATACRTMDMIQCPDVLGRQIPWAFGDGRLILIPHAYYDENAYYDRDSRAVCFGYYYAPDKDGEQSDRISFTCLSHDIVTHELGHAILDGLKPYYYDVSSASTAGFHEYFGDAVALTSSLENRELLRRVAGRNDSVTSKINFFTDIAKELGVGTGDVGAQYLRSARNEKKLGQGLTQEEINSSHDFSQILTGAYYDLIMKCYLHRLEGIANPNGGDRVKAVMKAAKITRRMLFRALDYCAPTDIDYLDYAQAVYRADQKAHPSEPNAYRKLWAEVCMGRNICFSEEQLKSNLGLSNKDLVKLDIQTLSASRTDAYNFIDANREVLSIPSDANLKVINLYRTNKISLKEYRVPQEVITEFVWPVDVLLSGNQFGKMSGHVKTLWCGGTLVLSAEGNLIHYTLKTANEDRIAKFKNYLSYQLADEAEDVSDGETFGAKKKRFSIRLEGGRVSIKRNPSMRCSSRGHHHA